MTDDDRLRRRRFLLLAAATTGGLAGCSGSPGTDTGNETTTGESPTTGGTGMGTESPGGTETGTPAEEAALRAVHASPDAPNVDVVVDGEAALTDVPFPTVSDYLTLPAGDHEVAIRPTGSDSAVFEGSLTLDPGTATTGVAYGEVSADSLQVAVLNDAVSPGSGDARVRAFHASPDAPAVDVTVEGGGVLLSNLEYGTASDYASVPAGDYTLEVRPHQADNQGDVVATFDVTVEGGTAYSAFAVGYVGAGTGTATGTSTGTATGTASKPPFDLLVAADDAPVSGGQMGTATGTGTGTTAGN